MVPRFKLKVETKEDKEAREERSKVTPSFAEPYKCGVSSAASTTGDSVYDVVFEVGSELGELVKDEGFNTFGIKDSSVYRKILFNLFKTAKLSKETSFIIVALFTLVKNKNRVLAGLDSIKDYKWKKQVVEFINNHVVSYTPDETSTSVIAAVHIPSCVPSVAAVAWILMRKRSERSVEGFMMNLWAAQLYVSDELMIMQKIWEYDFWDTVVTKSKSKAFENKGFNEEYWSTKAKDDYKLLDTDFKKIDRRFNKEELEVYLMSFKDLWSPAITKVPMSINISDKTKNAWASNDFIMSMIKEFLKGEGTEEIDSMSDNEIFEILDSSDITNLYESVKKHSEVKNKEYEEAKEDARKATETEKYKKIIKKTAGEKTNDDKAFLKSIDALYKRAKDIKKVHSALSTFLDNLDDSTSVTVSKTLATK
jgi:hypothetical protein